jgi:glycosyltransferase involved in cell wall biosynthesis
MTMKTLNSIAVISQEVEPAYGGQNGLTYDLVQHLKSKYKLTLIAQRASPTLSLDPAIAWKPIRIGGPSIIRFTLFPLLASLKALFGKYDLIICTGANSLFFDINIVHFLHMDLQKTCRDLNFNLGLYQKILLNLNVRIEKLCYRPDKFYLGVSDKITHAMETLLKLPQTQTVWNTTTALYQKPPTTLTQHSNTLSQKSIILFTGDLKRNIKNMDTLLKALARLNPDDYELWICASALPRTLKTSLKNIPHQYLGYRQDMAHIYAQADILVHPCIYEPFGLVVYEAWLAGLKIICSSANYVGVAALIQNDPNVWLLNNPMDDLALSQTLTTAFNQPIVSRTWEAWENSSSLQIRYEKAFNHIFSKISARKI